MKTKIPVIHRHRTAIGRNRLSLPTQLALKRGYLTPDTRVLDYGCGRGGDVRHLREHDIDAFGYDPFFQPHLPPGSLRFDVVLLNYVLNVIPCEVERAAVLRRAFSWTQRSLLVAIRVTPRSFETITTRQTYQKYFTDSEILHFLALTLRTTQIERLHPGIYIIHKQ